ncbi:MAG: hypothetical protein ACE5HD_07690 [Acidobacteriota bacterium]
MWWSKEGVMIRAGGLAAALAAFMVAGEARAQGATFVESEPNNSIATANVPPLNNLNLAGEYDTKGDEDFFKFDLIQGTIVRVFVGAIAGKNNVPTVQVLNASGQVLGEATRELGSSTLGFSVLVTATSPPGDGFIRIKNILVNSVLTPSYVISLAEGVPESEPNEDPSQATPFLVGNSDIPILGEFPFRPTPDGVQTLDYLVQDEGTPPRKVFGSVRLVIGENRPPSLTPVSEQKTPPSSRTLSPISLAATDPDGDGLTLSASPLPPFLALVDNGDGTGRLLLDPNNPAADSGPPALFDITVTATDDGTPPLSDSVQFQLVVSNNVRPVLDPIGEIFFPAGSLKGLFTFTASDPDGGLLQAVVEGIEDVHTKKSFPSLAKLILGSPSNPLTGTVAVNVTFDDFSQCGKVFACSQGLVGTICNGDDPALFDPVRDCNDPDAKCEAQKNTFVAFCTSGGDAATRLAECGTSATTCTKNDGETELPPASFPLTVVVTDDGLPPLSARESFDLVIGDNLKPILVPVPDQQITVDTQKAVFPITATDPEGGPLQFILLRTNAQRQFVTQENLVPGSTQVTVNPRFGTADFFSFETTQPDQTAIITLDYPVNLAILLQIDLFDPDGKLLGSDLRTVFSGSGGPKNPSLVLPLPQPGRYVLSVTSAQGILGNDSVAGYTLFAKFRQGVFELEPNQSFDEAIPISLTGGSGRISGLLQTSQDVDVYKVQVPAGKALVADLNSTSKGVQIMDSVVSTFLRRDLGRAFASSDDNSLVPAGANFSLVNKDGYVRVVPPTSGEVFIGVGDRNNLGSITGFEYELAVSLVDPARQEGEPNDQAGSAILLDGSEEVRGIMNTDTDVDRYTVNGRAGDTLLVNVNAFGIGSFLDARVVVRDGQGNLLADRDRSAFSPDPFVLIPSLPADAAYSVEVRHRQGTTGSGPAFYYEVFAVAGPPVQAVIKNPDIDRSGRVDGFDLALLARLFSQNQGDPLFDPDADLLQNNAIDGQDLSVLADFFGTDLANADAIDTDTVGDATPFFGPARKTSDLIGLGSQLSGSQLTITAFYAGAVTADTGGNLSIDSDVSSLTGSLGTPDAYVERRSLGSELEVFFDANGFDVFTVSDPRNAVFSDFSANVGDATVPKLIGAESRTPLLPTKILARQPVTRSGRSISFDLDTGLLGGSQNANVAALALSVSNVEPTDRLPNRGKITLRPAFFPGSVTVSQKVCSGAPEVLCTTDADCGGVACVDVDANPAILPTQAVYLRTQTGGPTWRDLERGSGTAGDDSGLARLNNDLMDHVFPLGVFPGLTRLPLDVFTRDLLYNFGFRDATFDPHLRTAIEGPLPPPDVDLYYFLGAEGDRAVVEVRTADDGATFNSEIQLFVTPLSIAALDPTSSAAQTPLTEQDLTFITAADDISATDLDARLDVILDDTAVYVVRVSLSPQGTPIDAPVPYELYHESLGPDEVSIPVVSQGPYPFNLGALTFHLQFDPTVIQFAGFDLARGLRHEFQFSGTSSTSAQEMAGELVVGSSGEMRFAIKSFVGNTISKVNTLLASQTGEVPLARLRFRGVGPGTTQLKFVPNPTTPGEPLVNLGFQGRTAGSLPPIYLPANGFGPGVTITVTP